MPWPCNPVCTRGRESQTIPLRNCPPLHTQHEQETFPTTTGPKSALKWNGFRTLRRKQESCGFHLDVSRLQVWRLKTQHLLNRQLQKQGDYKNRIYDVAIAAPLQKCSRGVGGLGSRDAEMAPLAGARSAGRKRISTQRCSSTLLYPTGYISHGQGEEVTCLPTK